jgi:HEPN domain-containing protein
MNRNDLQNLARIRLRESRLLLKNGHYEGAYYLCGYAVECALKACIAKKTKEHDFPDKRIVNASYTHSLNNLIKIAGLGEDFNKERKNHKDFESQWGIVKDWNESSRYKKIKGKDAKSLFSAVTEKQNGVLQWIKQHW